MIVEVRKLKTNNLLGWFCEIYINIKNRSEPHLYIPVSVAHWDACFCGYLSMKYFLRSFSPFHWLKKGQLSVFGNIMCTVILIKDWEGSTFSYNSSMRPSNKYVCKVLFFFVFVFKNKHDSLKVVKNIGSERAILEHFWPAWQTDAKNVLTSHLTCELWSMILLLNQSTDTSINLIYMYITYDYYDPLARMIIMIHLHTQVFGGGWVVRRCRVSYVTGASNWYWLTVGQGLLSL